MPIRLFHRPAPRCAARRTSLRMPFRSPCRPRRVRLLLAAVTLAACAPAAPSETPFDLGWGPDIEDGQQAAAPPSPGLIPEELRKPWPHAGRLGQLQRLAGTGPSEHLGGGYLRQLLLAEEVPRYALGRLTRPLPPGTLIVQRHSLPQTPEVAANYFVMERRGGVDKAAYWGFTVLDGQLKVATEGTPAACLRCHSDAPHHGVFGPPLAEAAP